MNGDEALQVKLGRRLDPPLQEMIPLSSTVLALATALLVLGAPPSESPQPTTTDSFRPDPTWKPIGRSLWFDPGAKQLVLRARVALREGPLEHLLCLKGTKEHEAVLATDAVPRMIHAGLILTGAKQGHPVRFLPKFEPPTGSAIEIQIQWQEDNKLRTADARSWVREDQSKRPLTKDWVFAGSEIFEDPDTKKPIYAADDGDLFTVANFANAILDLPFASTANDAERSFVANTEKIPPRGTLVTLFLRPRPAPDAAKR
ncbi:YdjY domain-containing protein [Singulisphaera sp. GP187]|uniref:YdjY domain-containing protein n=1 Tax=Singulisphaera sp. GP187 TaxID=1882752 RepID=UPI0020B13183|nr:YdjY domain-containing protein [Singulisphaera sp. GP187]